MSTKRIDVVAAMDNAKSCLSAVGDREEREALMDARAAVVHLIAAAKLTVIRADAAGFPCAALREALDHIGAQP